MKCVYLGNCKNKCSDSCIRYLEMSHLISESNIEPTKFMNPLLAPDEDYDAYCRLNDIKSDIVGFVEAGHNLYIASENTGNGKTTWAGKLMLKYFDEVWAGNGFRTRGLFIHVPKFLAQMKNFQNPVSEKYKSDIMNVDLVVWDDIASTGMSDYDISTLLLYIDARISGNKANIFTGNIVKEKQLQTALGMRSASRIWNTSKVIIFNAKDRRTA